MTNKISFSILQVFSFFSLSQFIQHNHTFSISGSGSFLYIKILQMMNKELHFIVPTLTIPTLGVLILAIFIVKSNNSKNFDQFDSVLIKFIHLNPWPNLYMNNFDWFGSILTQIHKWLNPNSLDRFRLFQICGWPINIGRV